MTGWDLLLDFLRPQRASIAMYCRVVFLFLLPPIAGVAAILFYAVGNPLSKATSLLVIVVAHSMDSADFWSNNCVAHCTVQGLSFLDFYEKHLRFRFVERGAQPCKPLVVVARLARYVQRKQSMWRDHVIVDEFLEFLIRLWLWVSRFP
jgi:hypothetical protein